MTNRSKPYTQTKASFRLVRRANVAFTYMQNAKILFQNRRSLENIVGRNDGIGQKGAVGHEFRRDFNQIEVQSPHEDRVLIAE